jgi:type IV pilus assembly protein PilX
MQTKHIAHSRQTGMVLVTSLLLLIVVTLLAVGMFRSFGLDEKIAGNVREKQRALSAAETAEQYAESWLLNGNGSTGVPCTTFVTATTAGNVGQVCSNVLTNAAQVPWTAGVWYAPTVTTPTVTTAMNVSTLGGQGSYYFSPAFYISYLGASPNGLGNIFQIDAVGYGGSADTVAVVESTYIVQQSSSCLSCSQ